MNASPAEGAQFVGEVAIDAATKTFTVRLIDINGTVLWETSLAAGQR